MYRSAARAALSTRSSPSAQFGRRFASTAPRKSGTFRGTILRWGLAGAVVYYYNTSTVFADEPKYAAVALLETQNESETYSTVDSIAAQRRAQARPKPQTSLQTGATSSPIAAPDAEPAVVGDPGEIEKEAEQQGAFNEETGEINWECSCLGGMAHGVCGEQFRAAFSCFVYSKDEPKGIDCIENFKAMQNCFREHPDIYGSELDEDELSPPPEGAEAQPISAQAEAQPTLDAQASSTRDEKHLSGDIERAQTTKAQISRDPSAPARQEEIVSKA